MRTIPTCITATGTDRPKFAVVAAGSGLGQNRLDMEQAVQPQERWIDAIATDISGSVRAAMRLLEMARRGFPGWAGRIRAWFAFVSRRRVDRRHAVFPGLLRISEMVAIAGSAILLAVLFADPPYLAAVKTGRPAYGEFFGVVTRFGESAWILYATGAVIVALSLVTADRFRGARKARLQTILLNAYFLFTTVAFSGLLTNLMKNLFGRARPPWTPLGDIWVAAPFRDNYHYAAFPSGHATTAGAAGMALALLFPRARVFFLVAGVWIAVSRPALGVHFPSDVLAGFLFGAAFSWYYARSFARKRLLFAFTPQGGLQLRRGIDGRAVATLGGEIAGATRKLAKGGRGGKQG
jgi:undecaprenyl-diphosphatase